MTPKFIVLYLGRGNSSLAECRRPDVGCWILDVGWEDARREAVRHTTGEAGRDCRDLVMISSLFVGLSRRIDDQWGVGRWFRDRAQGCGRPFDGFYADDFGAGRGFGAVFGELDWGRANQTHAAAVEFLAGV